MSDSVGGGAAPSPGSATSTGTAASQAISGPSANPSQPTAEPKYKVKINGSEREVTVNDLIKGYQLEQASNARFQQASEMEKRYKPLAEALGKKDFKAMVSQVPEHEFQAFAEQYLLQKMQFEQLPPGDKARIAAERRAAQLEHELQQERQGKETEAQERAMVQAATEVDNEIFDVFQRQGRKPTAYEVAALVDEMLAVNEGTGQRITAEQAYERAKRRLGSQTESHIGDLSDADLVSYLEKTGKLEGVRKHLLNQVMGKQQRVASSQPRASSAAAQPAKQKSFDDWFADKETQLRKRG